MGIPTYRAIALRALVTFILPITFVSVTPEFAVAAVPSYACSFSTDETEVMIGRADGKKSLGQEVWSDAQLVARLKKSRAQLKKAKTSTLKEKIQFRIKAIRKLRAAIKQCPTSPGEPDVTFENVAQIFQNKCMACHATEGNWQNTEAWYISSGRVVPRDLAASSLYTHLAGNPEGFTPGTMPKGIAPLLPKQIRAIKGWILGLQQPPAETFEFSCSDPTTSAPAPLKRLSRQQFMNTFTDLLSPFSGVEQAQIYGVILPALNVIPSDSPRKTFLDEKAFPGTDLSVSAQHISAVYNAALSFANEVTSTSSRRATFSLGNCTFATTSAGRTCLNNFLTQFGLRVHRRPLLSAELTAYSDYFYSRPAAVAFRDLIVTMLMSPDFFYLREDRGNDIQNGAGATVQLTGYELATRLSYLFWQTMPDVALFQAAADGSLLTEAGYRAQVDRLFANPRTRQTIDQFFEILLGMDRLPALNGINSPQFNSFAAGLNIPAGSTELVEHMRQEMVDLVDHYVWQTNESFSDLFLSGYSFARDPTLASLYGVAPWNGSHQSLVPFPSAQQSRGLLGRAAMQVSGSHLKSTVKLGARVLREWNCTPLNDPPPDIMGQVTPPPYDPTKSTRDRYEALTSPPACIGCHVQFNSIGFAMERLDALGRYREIEAIFDAAGIQVANIPINSTSEFRSLPAVPRTVSTPIDVFQAMIDTGKAEACFAQQYFRFSHRIHEDLEVNGCSLQKLHTELKREGGSMQGMLKQIVLSDDFKMRRVVP